MVSGYYGFGNAGDEIILSVLLDALEGHEVVVLSADPLATAREHGVKAVSRSNPIAIGIALTRSALLVSGGGGLIQDATGPRSVLYYLGIVRLARLLGVPFVIYAQGLGPLHAPSSRRAVSLLRGARMITVRDLESRELLEECGVQGAEVTADAAFALAAPKRQTWHTALEAVGVEPGRPVVALALRRWDHPEFIAYQSGLATRLRDLLGAQVVLVPMQLPDDAEVCTRVRALHPEGAKVLSVPSSVASFTSLFGCFNLVVGMRLHALILAAIAGVPFLGLGYDPKIDAFMKTVGCADSCFPLMAPMEPVALRAQRLLAEGLKAAVTERISALQQAAARNNERLRAVLENLR